MELSPHLFTVFSSAPVQVQIDGPVEFAALGISTICEMNTQRFTAMGVEEVACLTAMYTEGGVLGRQKAEVWGVGLYPNEPIEAADLQPFVRPQRGNPCLFQMAGDLSGIDDNERFPVGDQWPVSCTDQERAFCLLQERIRKLWREGRPDQEMRLALVADYSGRLDKLGMHNFIHWDGEFLFAYSSLNGGLEPLGFQMFTGQAEVTGALPLTITADPDTQILIVANRSLIESSQNISAGQVACFARGELVDTCDPVSFWE